MRFYTNVQQLGNNLYVRGYEDGIAYKHIVPFKPYLFISSTSVVPQIWKTITGSSVEKMDFDSIADVRKFMKDYEGVKGFTYHGQDKWPYVYIHDNFKSNDYDISKIKVLYLDIETDSKDGFADIDLANKEITAITIRLNNHRLIFGLGDYTPSKHEHYIKCQDEKYLLRKFLTMWNTPEMAPDVVTGWNIETYDIPYLVNRIRNVLGNDDAKMLSPWRVLREKFILSRGREVKIYIPMGISVLDYLALYKKFTYTEQAAYSLNHICHVELDEKKIDYSEYSSLADLYEQNHQKFIEYNIRDVDLVYRLEEKLRFIELVFAIAYDAKVNYNDAFTSVLLWDIIVYNYLMNQNIVLPKYERKDSRPFEGGYVKDPIMGMSEWVMSFDLKSLYPHIIIQYNISPEMFVGKVPNVNVQKLLDSKDEISGQNTMAANGCIFRKNKQGFLSALMESQFEIRELFKKKKKEAVKNGDKLAEIKYDKAQLAKKIQLNSLYGSLSNVGFRFYNADMAEAITLSGQLSIRYMHDRVNEFMNYACKTEGVDYIIAVDTDSLYIRFKDLVDLYCKGKTRDQIINFLDTVAKEKLNPFIKEQYDLLGKKMNVAKQAMEMNREVIGDKAIWTGKKHYIINVWDKEGDRLETPELKIMGIETVRSSTPEICKTSLEKAINIIMNADEETLQEFVAQFKEEFFKAPFEDVAFPRSANNLAKYSDPVTLYKKGTPIQVRGALLYNKLLKERNMTKLSPIFEGEKIKFCYLTLPNPTFDNVISAPGFLPFVDIGDYIDYNTQWEKAFLEPLNSILEKIGWTSKKEANLEALFA